MKKNKKPFLSVIIPVFNEEKRIKKLSGVINYFKKQKYPWEIIIINDGSTDNTEHILKKYKGKSLKLISHFPNLGKGAAIKKGMLSATGKYRLFTDIDLSTPISEIEKFLPYFKKYNIIIGSRKLRNSNLLTRQSLSREYLGKVFTSLSKLVLNINVSDFTCGFKCFSEETVKAIFPNQTIHGWSFDSEILFIGKHKGKSILEIPVTWKNDPRTRVKFPRDIIISLWELTIIRINAIRGLYK